MITFSLVKIVMNCLFNKKGTSWMNGYLVAYIMTYLRLLLVKEEKTPAMFVTNLLGTIAEFFFYRGK